MAEPGSGDRRAQGGYEHDPGCRAPRQSPENPLGAFCDLEGLPGEAAGTLAGLRFAVKDNIDVQGRHVGAGNPDWRRTHPAAERSHVAVSRLLSAGASMVGRTITDEMALSMHGINWHEGAPVNAAAPGALCGGSSCGSAAAVAGGLVDFALGTDTGGSVRVPASYCGLYGWRPTHGRIPLEGVVPLAPTFDTVGVFSRQSSTLGRVAACLLGGSGDGWRPRRLLLAADAFAFAGPEVTDALRASVHRLVERFEEVSVIDLFEGAFEFFAAVYCVRAGVELWEAHRAWVEAVAPTFGPDAEENMKGAASLPAEVAERAERGVTVSRLRLQEMIGVDSIVCLPAASGPPPLRDTPLEQLHEIATRCITLTSPGGLAGLPQISIPAARLDGLPVGLSLMAPAGCDEGLLALAMELESNVAREEVPRS